MIELYVWKSNGSSLNCDIATRYVQFLLTPTETEYTVVECYDTSPSPDGTLPFLRVSSTETYAFNEILPYLLLRLSSSSTVVAPSESIDSAAFHSLLATTLSPLILHSLFSLPQNWSSRRSKMSEALPFPASLYRPELLRAEAKSMVEASDEFSILWGLGGEAEKDEVDERRKKRALLETGSEGWKDRQDQQRQEIKKEMKLTFGKDKVIGIARKILSTFESALESSTTSYLFSSPTPQSVDIHLFALLSLVLLDALPQPLLSTLVTSSFPLILSHTHSMGSVAANRPQPVRRSASIDYRSAFLSFLPSLSDLASFSSAATKQTSSKNSAKKTKQVELFERGRLYFVALVVVGLIGFRFASAPRAVNMDDEWEDA